VIDRAVHSDAMPKRPPNTIATAAISTGFPIAAR
jgi:hypothetical protein